LKVDILKVDILKVDILKVDILKVDILKVDILKVDILKVDILKVDILKVDILKVDILTWHNSSCLNFPKGLRSIVARLKGDPLHHSHYLAFFDDFTTCMHFCMYSPKVFLHGSLFVYRVARRVLRILTIIRMTRLG
jgi:hypothetical protein